MVTRSIEELVGIRLLGTDAERQPFYDRSVDDEPLYYTREWTLTFWWREPLPEDHFQPTIGENEYNLQLYRVIEAMAEQVAGDLNCIRVQPVWHHYDYQPESGHAYERQVGVSFWMPETFNADGELIPQPDELAAVMLAATEARSDVSERIEKLRRTVQADREWWEQRTSEVQAGKSAPEPTEAEREAARMALSRLMADFRTEA
ncbi:hypothetical protein [Rhodococcoides fascians]|uniref:hypothetical protein n=1 Tax=Rhodococcoides fascians TaxID=1828 RepID=UPI00278743F5|nr:hypothetical protein [Rhodococcus fascians]MDQ0281746.1 hypothetical protein [Rhodococcus fascians]